MNCYASQTTAADASAEVPTFTTQDIPLEKTFLKEAENEAIQFISPAFKEKNLVISATLNPSGSDVSLLIRDLSTNVATGFSGSLGRDQSAVASLATMINGEQKLISLTCHAAVAAGNLQPHSPQNF